MLLLIFSVSNPLSSPGLGCLGSNFQPINQSGGRSGALGRHFKILASFMDMMDLSLFESLSSSAMTTQLAMIVMMMIHSKGGQLTSQVISFLTGLVGVKRNKEVGPRSSGSSFFFFPILTGLWGYYLEAVNIKRQNPTTIKTQKCIRYVSSIHNFDHFYFDSYPMSKLISRLIFVRVSPF